MQSKIKRLKFAMTAAILLWGIVACAASGWAQNATPFIDDTMPAAAQLGGSGFTLTVRGTGFSAESLIYWQVGANTTVLTTTIISPTELTANVPASFLRAPATAQITVRNTDLAPEVGTSNAALLPVTVPSLFPAFAIAGLNGLGGNPLSSATGDFNGDGKADVAVCGFDGLFVLLGNGDGTFRQSASFVGGPCYGLAVGDFNGDGKLDIVAPLTGLFTYLGNGDGTFTPAPGGPVFSNGGCLSNAVTGDLNGDGKLDIVATDNCTGSVATFLGKGDGTFTFSDFIVLGDRDTYWLTIGDFDGDGKLDVAALILTDEPANGNDYFLANAIVLLGKGDGSFTNKSNIALGYGFLPEASDDSILAADFDGDGKLDLAISSCGIDSSCETSQVAVFLGNGDGTFTYKTSFAGGGSGIAAGDVNGDGHVDLVFARFKGVSLMLGNGDGTFANVAVPAGNENVLSVSLGDFNNDGRLDIAAVTGPLGQNTDKDGLVTLIQQYPPLRAAPFAVDFGKVFLYLGKIRDITVTNVSNVPVTSISVQIAPGSNAPTDFIPFNLCPTTLAAGASCQVAVLFYARPGTLNPSATLNVSYQGYGSPLAVPMVAQIFR